MIKARNGTAGHPQAGRDETPPAQSAGEQVEDTVTALAQHAERVLPEIARRLFTLDPACLLAELPNAQLKLCSLPLGGARTMS